MTEPRPHLRVVSGDATPEEIAALVSALYAVAAARRARQAGGSGSRPAATRTGWRDRSALLRRPLPSTGPGRWKGLC